MTTETFTTAGTFTWTCPSGVTSVQIECWGAGGGGHTAGTYAGSGGGGGAYAKKNTYAVSSGTEYSYTIGTHGAEHNAGGSTTFNTNICIAVGGSGATAWNSHGHGGVDTSCTGDVRYSGGYGGLNTNPGQSRGCGGGGSAGTSSNGNNREPKDIPGAAAVTGGGKGADGNAESYTGAGVGGGGGGGALSYVNGGNSVAIIPGGDGKIILTYTIVLPPRLCFKTP